MNTPKVSVVIPTYNRANVITRSILSAANQETIDDIEIVVVDDGSTDNTKEVIEKLNLPNVRYLKKENGGVSSARNVGIRESKGEFIALLDSDDMLRSWSIPYRSAFLDQNPHYDGIAGSAININSEFQVHKKMYSEIMEKDRKLAEWESFNSKLMFNNANSKTEFFKLCYHYMISTQGKIPYTTSTTMIRRKSLIDNQIYYNEKLKNAEDMEFIYKCAKALNIKYDIIRAFAYIQFQENGLTKNLKNGLAQNQKDEVLAWIQNDYKTNC